MCTLTIHISKNDDSLTIGGYLPLDKVYNYEPLPKELSPDEGKYVFGAQEIFSFDSNTSSNLAKAEYMLFPRLAALSEVLWSPKKRETGVIFKNVCPIF